jgi:hypothetical protein
MTVILALGGMGIGYAAWTDTIWVDGSVNTGEVCIEVTCPFGPSGESSDPSPPYTVAQGAPAFSLDYNARPEVAGTPDFWVDPVRTDKNVAWVTSNCEELTPPRKLVTLTFHNVYPSYFSHLAFGLRNCGTIPIKMDHVIFTDQWGRSQTITKTDYLTFDLSGNDTDDFELYWGDNFGAQLEPGGGWSMDFWTHFMQDEGIDFSQPQTFTLTIEIVVVQWNEYPLPLP